MRVRLGVSRTRVRVSVNMYESKTRGIIHMGPRTEASRHTTQHHITSHHITSHHITSQHITSHHITYLSPHKAEVHRGARMVTWEGGGRGQGGRVVVMVVVVFCDATIVVRVVIVVVVVVVVAVAVAVVVVVVVVVVDFIIATVVFVVIACQTGRMYIATRSRLYINRCIQILVVSAGCIGAV